MMEDDKIIELFYERSEQAVVELSKKYGKLCTSIAVNIIGNTDDAEECVNDVYMNVWSSIPPSQPKSLMAFVCGVTKNLSLNRYKFNNSQKRKNTYDQAIEELESVIESDFEMDKHMESKELSGYINEYLMRLKEIDRAIFVRRYWMSQSISDIAKVLGRSNHYINVRLLRARQGLKDFLNEKGAKS